jgi:hypothetical protein
MMARDSIRRTIKCVFVEFSDRVLKNRRKIERNADRRFQVTEQIRARPERHIPEDKWAGEPTVFEICKAIQHGIGYREFRVNIVVAARLKVARSGQYTSLHAETAKEIRRPKETFSDFAFAKAHTSGEDRAGGVPSFKGAFGAIHFMGNLITERHRARNVDAVQLATYSKPFECRARTYRFALVHLFLGHGRALYSTAAVAIFMALA